jgi:glycosyltransferase involved in cell wall biosynthesis
MNQKILVVGPALSQTGYGEQCRFALRALMSRPDVFEVYLKPLPWGNSSWLLPTDEDRNWIDMLIQKTAFHIEHGGNFDISLQVTIPNEWEKITPINIGYTAGIETTKIVPQWLEKSFLMDKIITISNHSKNTFADTVYDATKTDTGEKIKVKCETPIEVVHYPVRHYTPEPIDIHLDYDFNFLTVAQWGPRKNLENTIRWWIEEFRDEEVGLIVKTNLFKTSVIDRQHTKDRLKALLSDYKDRKCKVYLLHGNLTAGELTFLYQHPKVKCLTSLTHGEGFGLPLFEAAYNGLPIIAPDWSGHVDFLYAPKKIKRKNKKATFKNTAHFAKVDYELKPVAPEVVWQGVIHPDHSWCYAKHASYKKQLRNVYSNINRFKNIANSLKKHIHKTFTAESQYAAFVEQVGPSSEFDVEGWLNNLDVETHE